MNASELKKGDFAKIHKVEVGALQLKLTEMGCYIGNEIQLLYVAPMGDPLAFNINGYILGLRKEEAKLIQVTPF